MKIFVLALLIIAGFIGTAVIAYDAATLKHRSELVRLRGEISIYKTQVDNYAKVLRTIRETAATATLLDKTP